MSKKILEVQKIKQLPNHCGVASLLMVLQYYGFKTDQKSLAKYFDEPDKIEHTGVYWEDVARVSREIGFIVDEYFNIGFDDIVDFINNERPIIARGRSHVYPRARHFRVIKGYDDRANLVYVNDPAYIRRNSFTWEQFNKVWLIGGKTATQNYGVILKPK